MLKYSTLLLFFIIATLACKKKEEPFCEIVTPIETRNCNGFPELCNKRFDEVAYAMTHNSHANTTDFSSLAANQDGLVFEQLTTGVRGLGIKVYNTSGSITAPLFCSGAPDDLYLYHGDPSLGCERFDTYLDVVKVFLENYPDEIIPITIEGSAPPNEVMQAFTNAGLEPYMHSQDFSQPWPTLLEMLNTGKRIVVFMDDGTDTDTFPYIHDMWNFLYDTHYNHSNPSTFDCNKDRGNHTGGSIFLLNHFITDITPQQDDAAIINELDFLLPRARGCAQTNNHIPNFVMVDFYATGDVVEVVDSLNLNGW